MKIMCLFFNYGIIYQFGILLLSRGSKELSKNVKDSWKDASCIGPEKIQSCFLLLHHKPVTGAVGSEDMTGMRRVYFNLLAQPHYKIVHRPGGR